MPLYEYECPRCGNFDKIRKFSDPPLKKCPTCGSPITKLLSAPAIQFKGAGWYVTDYAAKSGEREPKGGESTASDSKATESKASDSKNDGKSDSKAETTSKTDGKSDSKAETKSKSDAASAPSSKPSKPTGADSK